MDRVFLDANVLFSAAYGSPGLQRLWLLTETGACTLVASEYVIEEARRNLDDEEQRRRLGALLHQVNRVDEAPPDLPCSVTLPDKDRPVFLAAIVAGATHLLTGDVQHFGTYFGGVVQGVRILRPAEYLAQRT